MARSGCGRCPAANTSTPSPGTAARSWACPSPGLAPAWWKRLGDARAPTAARAGSQAFAPLAAAPEQAVPFLGQKLKPVAAPDPKLVAELIADLDNNDFAARQKATEALEKLAEL